MHNILRETQHNMLVLIIVPFTAFMLRHVYLPLQVYNCYIPTPQVMSFTFYMQYAKSYCVMLLLLFCYA